MSALAPRDERASVSAGPPTRFRYLIHAALESLARRLRPGTRRPADADVAAAVPAPVNALAPADPDLSAIARLCTELGQVETPREAERLLEEAARILEAVGLIVWIWDPRTADLRPALAHGYSESVLTQLPRVGRDADNATAEAFRSAQTCVVNGSDRVSGALVVPLLAPERCVGVLAVELQGGSEQKGLVRALVTIFAAQLARVAGAAHPSEAADRRLA